ncbi:hypothetical protein Tco_0924447 [Tanacetum coccineum]|uniref:Uncharacterized protein n=1 Tax=Tanacetum coccineum TaxID=301880 RepID=A0ABQ5D4V6_9ASTR
MKRKTTVKQSDADICTRVSSSFVLFFVTKPALEKFVDRQVVQFYTKPLDEDDDVVVFENSETKEEDVKEDESDHNKERYTFEDDDDDEEFDDLD